MPPRTILVFFRRHRADDCNVGGGQAGYQRLVAYSPLRRCFGPEADLSGCPTFGSTHSMEPTVHEVFPDAVREPWSMGKLPRRKPPLKRGFFACRHRRGGRGRSGDRAVSLSCRSSPRSAGIRFGPIVFEICKLASPIPNCRKTSVTGMPPSPPALRKQGAIFRSDADFRFPRVADPENPVAE